LVETGDGELVDGGEDCLPAGVFWGNFDIHYGN
jgi:hypothetical protein